MSGFTMMTDTSNPPESQHNLTNMDINAAACLDAEFVEGDEIIELSIYSLDRTEIYHRLFRPASYRTWDSSIHHITPEMVKEAPLFESERETIQRILDSRRHLIGFALDNDTTHLTKEGITGLNHKSIIELRDWFWINHGIAHDLDLYQGISLASVASHLDVTFGEQGMHSAGGDTLATLDCFRILYDRFCDARSLDPADFDSVIDTFNDLYAERKEEYDRNHAEGYALLLRVGADGYTLRIKRDEPRPGGRLAACIRVADRQKAGVELRNMMKRRPMIGRGVYRLTPKDIEAFKAYSNGYDADEHAYFKKLQGLSSRFNVSGLKR